MSLTNGHVMMGYQRAEAHVPRLPMHIRGADRGVEVVDSDGYWMATFRNDEDAGIYIAERTAKQKAGRAEYELRCQESARNEPPEGKQACPCCGKFVGNVRQHRKDSAKCKTITKDTNEQH